MQVLNIQNPAEKPKFSTVSKIDNRKNDLQLYKQKDLAIGNNKKDEMNLSKKVTPLK
jgi:hypothetical protein